MQTAFDNVRVRRVATLLMYETPVAEIRESLLGSGLTEEEAMLTYYAGKVYLQEAKKDAGVP